MSQCFVRKVSNNDSLIEDLGADSLDTVELVMALEEEFGKKRNLFDVQER